MIKYLLIDWDNTIWDFSANSALSLRECYHEFGLSPYFGSEDVFLATYYRVNDRLWALYRSGAIDRAFLVANRFNYTLLSMGLCDYNLAQRIDAAYLDHVELKSELVPGARAVVDYLRNKGYVLIVITNGFCEVQQRKLRNSGIQHLFHHIVFSSDAMALKPSAKFFDYVFRTTGAVPGQSMVIGDDAESDMAGAVGYGLRAMYFNRAGSPCPYPVDYEIHNLEQIMEIL